jgi:hypothetical protein
MSRRDRRRAEAQRRLAHKQRNQAEDNTIARRRAPGRAGDASDGQAGGIGRGRDQGLLTPWRACAGPLLRERHHLDCSRADRSQGARSRDDPTYVDVAVRRWQTYAGKAAVLAASGETFETIEEQRAAKPEVA